jgi:hypothetical protein
MIFTSPTAKSHVLRPTWTLRLAGACAVALLFLTGCSREVACEDSEVVDKMLELAKRDVVTDLAGQCASRLYGRIPQVAPQCPKDSDGHTTACVAVCNAWAETHVTAKANAFETLFKDDLVATRRCRADVRFDVAFDGGQTVDARITYLAAPKVGGAQVVLSD